MEFAKPGTEAPKPSESNANMMVGGGSASVSTSGEMDAAGGAEGGNMERGPSVRTNMDSGATMSQPSQTGLAAGTSAPVATTEEGGSGKTIGIVVVVIAAAAAAAFFLL